MEQPHPGQAIRDARINRGLTIEVLAHRAGLAAATVSRIERGKVRPNVATLHQIAGALDLTTSQMLAEAAS